MVAIDRRGEFVAAKLLRPSADYVALARELWATLERHDPEPVLRVWRADEIVARAEPGERRAWIPPAAWYRRTG